MLSRNSTSSIGGKGGKLRLANVYDRLYIIMFMGIYGRSSSIRLSFLHAFHIGIGIARIIERNLNSTLVCQPFDTVIVDGGSDVVGTSIHYVLLVFWDMVWQDCNI